MEKSSIHNGDKFVIFASDSGNFQLPIYLCFMWPFLLLLIFDIDQLLIKIES